MGVSVCGYGVGFWVGRDTALGMGSSRGLVSKGLCRLGSLCAMIGGASTGSGAQPGHLRVANLADREGPNVDEERMEFGGGVKIVKDESERGVYASRWGVCGVLRTQDVSCVYHPITALQ